jgi:hypothetical protein
MQYLLYCVSCFKFCSTTKKVFVANAQDTTSASREIFMQWYAHDVEVTSAGYRKANGIQSPFDNDIDNP